MVKIVPHESLYESILRASKEAKSNVALYYFNEKIRWDRFIFRINQFANGLKKDGVKPGDVVSVLENKKNNPVIKESVEKTAGLVIPEWLDLDVKNLSAKVLRTVTREEIDIPVEEHLIVELYSK